MDLNNILDRIDTINYNTDMDNDSSPTFANECITLRTIDDILYAIDNKEGGNEW